MTDKELIEQFGGSSELARRLGTTKQRVQNWKSRGIPARVKLQFPAIFLQSLLSSSKTNGVSASHD